jgi:hypothetical protein
MREPHRFLVCRPGRPPISWQPPEATDETGHDVAYFGRALAIAVDRLGSVRPLTFIITWDLAALPEKGRHVVAIVQGDEDARIPRWSTDVRITFKCYGTRPHWMPVFPRPGSADALEVAHFARRAVRWLPGASERAWAGGQPWRSRPPIVPIPLGYYNQLNRPLVPFAERKWSVTFAGSVGGVDGTRSGWRARLATPKERARAEMLDALGRLGRKCPHEAIKIVTRPDFPPLSPGKDKHARELAGSYSDLLADTRVALVPRGNSSETFRFFEALRAGCVPVCESLPDHWFYRAAPIVRVRRWDELGSILAPLLANPPALEELHGASLRWWDTRCSEEALGRLIAAHISAGGSE